MSREQGFLSFDCGNLLAMPFGSVSRKLDIRHCRCRRQPCSLMMPDDNDSEQNPASYTSSISISIQSCQVHYRVRLTTIRKAKIAKSDVVLYVKAITSTAYSTMPKMSTRLSRALYIFSISLSLSFSHSFTGSCRFLPRNPFLRQSLCPNLILFAARRRQKTNFSVEPHHHHKF